MAGVGIASHDRPWGIRPLVTGVASPVRPWGVRPLVTGIGFMFGRVGGSAVGYWYWVHVRPCGIRPLGTGVAFIIGRGGFGRWVLVLLAMIGRAGVGRP